jgi:hypothetical protein
MEGETRQASAVILSEAKDPFHFAQAQAKHPRIILTK